MLRGIKEELPGFQSFSLQILTVTLLLNKETHETVQIQGVCWGECSGDTSVLFQTVSHPRAKELSSRGELVLADVFL